MQVVLSGTTQYAQKDMSTVVVETSIVLDKLTHKTTDPLTPTERVTNTEIVSHTNYKQIDIGTSMALKI